MGRKKKNKQKKQLIEKVVSGTIDIKSSGIAFIKTESYQEDIFINPDNKADALPQDTVQVEVIPGKMRGKKNVGKVKKVLKRKSDHIVGQITSSGFVPFDKKLQQFKFKLQQNNLEVNNNDYFSCKIEGYSKRKFIISLAMKVKGKSNKEVFIEHILTQNDFSSVYPKNIEKQAIKFQEKISPKEIKKRKDLRKEMTFTIDPDNAKDFDDALSINILPNGNTIIGIHIADVTHYVKHETDIDKEAYKRSTSVYIPEKVFPMLPERLSNNLCSLKPNVDRLAFSVMVEFNQSKNIVKTSFHKSVIHSDKRFTYDEVLKIIKQKTAKNEIDKSVKILHHIAQSLRKKRFSNGAINFSSVEKTFQLDSDKKPIDTKLKTSQESHQLVEEFMILANHLVAENLSKTKYKKKILYRVHDKPPQEKLETYKRFIKSKGYTLDISSLDKIASTFNQILSQSKGKEEFYLIHQLGIRTMAKALYSPKNIGHYGLGLKDYSHFTSPIRRYSDIVVHRALECQMTNTPFTMEDIGQIGKHCTQKEIDATEVERSVNKLYEVMLLSNHIGQQYEGVISGVSASGFWVEVEPFLCEGFVSIHQLLEIENYVFSPTDYEICSLRNKKNKYAFGDKVNVIIERTNIEKRHVDLMLVFNHNKHERTTKKN